MRSVAPYNFAAVDSDDVESEKVEWTHDALEHLYDPAFLRKHIGRSRQWARFADERDVQSALMNAIKQLRPPDSISIHSPAWRTYNILNLRYVEGMVQREVAAELNVSERHLRNEQRVAIQALTTLLFDRAESLPEQVAGQRDERPLQHDVDLTEKGAEWVRLDEALRTVLALLDPLLHRQNLQVRVALPALPPITSTGSMLTRQLLISIISWLIHGEMDSTLEIAITLNEAGVQLSANKPHRLAENPARASETNEVLDAVRQIAEAMKVRLSMFDTGDGQRVEIQLPAADVQPVLVIDDDSRAIELVRRYLQTTHQFVVIEATQPEEALHKAVTLRPACILLDVMMPNRDGWELLTLLKTAPETAAIPIIISSVLKERDLPLALGASAVLRKPFNTEQLLAALKQVLPQANIHAG